jgi:adenylosuccinate lyase
MEAAQARDEGAERNDLLVQLAADPMFRLSGADVQELLDPHRYVGRAPEQVDEFLAEVLEPALADEGAGARTEREEVRV